MTDDTQAKIVPEGETPVSAVPTEEQKVPVPTETQEEVPQNQEAGKSLETKADTSLDLPEGVSERTREQFDKLKRQNAEYKERLLKEQTFGSMNVRPVAPQPEIPLYDPDTGLVNTEALNDLQKRQRAAEERATRAEQAVSSYIEGQETREAYNAHPVLNPESDNFDAKLHQATRAFLMDSMAYPENYGGKTLTFKEAADFASGLMGGGVENPKEVTERMTRKEQASLEVSGRPGQGVKQLVNQENEEALIQGTRRGNKQAMIARMKRIAKETAQPQ